MPNQQYSSVEHSLIWPLQLCKRSISLVRVVERIVVEENQDEGHGIVAGVSSC